MRVMTKPIMCQTLFCKTLYALAHLILAKDLRGGTKRRKSSTQVHAIQFCCAHISQMAPIIIAVIES